MSRLQLADLRFLSGFGHALASWWMVPTRPFRYRKAFVYLTKNHEAYTVEGSGIPNNQYVWCYRFNCYNARCEKSAFRVASASMEPDAT
eukprot:6532861-Prymnesium_polylepis.1